VSHRRKIFAKCRPALRERHTPVGHDLRHFCPSQRPA
jgi:hypothetical protein